MTEKDKIVGIVGIYEFLDTIAETAARIFNATNVTFRRIEDNVLGVIGAAGPTAAKSGRFCLISRSNRWTRRYALSLTIAKSKSRTNARNDAREDP